MAKRFPIRPSHPERNCWGCDRYCAADDMICGNGTERTQHPVELFGDDWREWEAEAAEQASGPRPDPNAPVQG
jgi:hypothetical protein